MLLLAGLLLMVFVYKCYKYHFVALMRTSYMVISRQITISCKLSIPKEINSLSPS